MPFTVLVTTGGSVVGIHTSGTSLLRGAGCSEIWEPGTPLGNRSYLTMTKGARTVDLRNPEFGNTELLNNQLIRHENSSGIIIVAHPSWRAHIKSFVFTFKAISETDKEDYEDFIRNTAGQEITIVDHENITRTGVITNSVISMPQAGRGCQYQLAFAFEET
jgi:hypothetical protein